MITTLKKQNLGEYTLRIVQNGRTLVGVLVHGQKVTQYSGTDEAQLWQKLIAECAASNPNYFGFDGAKTRFHYFFKGGFSSPNYIEAERDYKMRAKAKLDSIASPEAAVSGNADGQAVWSAISKLNLLEPRFEAARFKDLLESKDATEYLKRIADFTLQPSQQCLSGLSLLLKPYPNLKWAAWTLLPFLWDPNRHMFLKPGVTKDFAERVGHRFARDYKSNPSIKVYESLLSLKQETESELADMAPQDGIDVQSFIFVVGGYDIKKEPQQL